MSNKRLPQHQVPPNETYTKSLIQQFQEVNEHYNNATNEMHIFSYSTNISTSEVSTYHKVMKQDDMLEFTKAIEKEVRDHES